MSGRQSSSAADITRRRNVHASWLALVDAMKLELIRLAEHDATVERVVEEYCWGV